MDSRSPSGQQLPSTHSDLSILSLKQLHDFYTAALRLLEIEISSPLTACNICGGIGLALLALFGSVSIVFSSIPLIKNLFFYNYFLFSVSSLSAIYRLVSALSELSSYDRRGSGESLSTFLDAFVFCSSPGSVCSLHSPDGAASFCSIS